MLRNADKEAKARSVGSWFGVHFLERRELEHAGDDMQVLLCEEGVRLVGAVVIVA